MRFGRQWPLPRARGTAARPVRDRRRRVCSQRRPRPKPPGTPRSAEDAEEAYGDYQLVVDAIADRLLDIRESYARSLDDDAASEYSAAFTRGATRRYRRYATLLADLDES